MGKGARKSLRKGTKKNAKTRRNRKRCGGSDTTPPEDMRGTKIFNFGDKRDSFFQKLYKQNVAKEMNDFYDKSGEMAPDNTQSPVRVVCEDNVDKKGGNLENSGLTPKGMVIEYNLRKKTDGFFDKLNNKLTADKFNQFIGENKFGDENDYNFKMVDKDIVDKIGGNLEKSELTPEEIHEAEGFKLVIESFLTKEKETPSLKYASNKRLFDDFYNTYIIQKIPININLSRSSYEGLRDLTHLIIKDDAHDLFFNADAASFTELINNVYQYFTSDRGADHEITVRYLKNIVNGKPFIHVNHESEGYNSIHDVNNLFAYVKNEISRKLPPSDLFIDKKNTAIIHQ